MNKATLCCIAGASMLAAVVIAVAWPPHSPANSAACRLVPYLPPSAGTYATGPAAADLAGPRLGYTVVPSYPSPGRGGASTFRGTVVFTGSTHGGRHCQAPRVIYDTWPGPAAPPAAPHAIKPASIG